MFEAPRTVLTRELPRAEGDDGPAPIERCSLYAGFAVKEFDEHQPDGSVISVVPLAPDTGRFACDRALVAGERLLNDGHAAVLLGLRGRFMLLTLAGSGGPAPFAVLDITSGRRVFEDAFDGRDELRRFDLAHGRLTISYMRGVSGRCSILAGGAACWARIAQDATLPPAIRALPPPIAACRAGYRASVIGQMARREEGGREVITVPDDPSMIGYRVTATLDASGMVGSTTSGGVLCRPDP